MAPHIIIPNKATWNFPLLPSTLQRSPSFPEDFLRSISPGCTPEICAAYRNNREILPPGRSRYCYAVAPAACAGFPTPAVLPTDPCPFFSSGTAGLFAVSTHRILPNRSRKPVNIKQKIPYVYDHKFLLSCNGQNNLSYSRFSFSAFHPRQAKISFTW